MSNEANILELFKATLRIADKESITHLDELFELSKSETLRVGGDILHGLKEYDTKSEMLADCEYQAYRHPYVLKSYLGGTAEENYFSLLSLEPLRGHGVIAEVYPYSVGSHQVLLAVDPNEE